MIKMSVEIPEIWDVSNPDSVRQWMVAVKQYCEELARKAQSLQMELRSGAPTIDDVEEGEFVRATNNNIYTKLNNVIRTISTS